MTAPLAEPAVLRWAIRSSFRDYVKALPDGREVLSDGAVDLADGRIAFPGSIGSQDGSPRRYVFGGSVTFTGHGGLLDVELRAPQIELVTGGRSTVTVLDRATQRWAIAAFTEWRDVDKGLQVAAPRLTWTGATALGGVYEAGDHLDPFEISLSDR